MNGYSSDDFEDDFDDDFEADISTQQLPSYAMTTQNNDDDLYDEDDDNDSKGYEGYSSYNSHNNNNISDMARDTYQMNESIVDDIYGSTTTIHTEESLHDKVHQTVFPHSSREFRSDMKVVKQDTTENGMEFENLEGFQRFEVPESDDDEQEEEAKEHENSKTKDEIYEFEQLEGLQTYVVGDSSSEASDDEQATHAYPSQQVHHWSSAPLQGESTLENYQGNMKEKPKENFERIGLQSYTVSGNDSESSSSTSQSPQHGAREKEDQIQKDTNPARMIEGLPLEKLSSNPIASIDALTSVRSLPQNLPNLGIAFSQLQPNNGMNQSCVKNVLFQEPTKTGEKPESASKEKGGTERRELPFSLRADDCLNLNEERDALLTTQAMSQRSHSKNHKLSSGRESTYEQNPKVSLHRYENSLLSESLTSNNLSTSFPSREGRPMDPIYSHREKVHVYPINRNPTSDGLQWKRNEDVQVERGPTDFDYRPYCTDNRSRDIPSQVRKERELRIHEHLRDEALLGVIMKLYHNNTIISGGKREYTPTYSRIHNTTSRNNYYLMEAESHTESSRTHLSESRKRIQNIAGERYVKRNDVTSRIASRNIEYDIENEVMDSESMSQIVLEQVLKLSNSLDVMQRQSILFPLLLDLCESLSQCLLSTEVQDSISYIVYNGSISTNIFSIHQKLMSILPFSSSFHQSGQPVKYKLDYWLTREHINVLIVICCKILRIGSQGPSNHSFIPKPLYTAEIGPKFTNSEPLSNNSRTKVSQEGRIPTSIGLDQLIEQDITFQIEAKLFHLTGDYRSRRPQLVQEQLEDTLNEMLRDSSIQDLLVKRVVNKMMSSRSFYY